MAQRSPRSTDLLSLLISEYPLQASLIQKPISTSQPGHTNLAVRLSSHDFCKHHKILHELRRDHNIRVCQQRPDESLPVRARLFYFSARRSTQVIPRFNEAGDEGRLHLGDGIVDRDAGTFVQDLNTEDTHRGGRALLVDTLEGDIEGQHLVGVPGLGDFLEAGDGGNDLAGQGIDRGAGSDAVVTNQCGLIDGVVGEEDVRVGAELRDGCRRRWRRTGRPSGR